MNPILSVTNFSYAYGKKIALTEANFALHEGTVTALLGTNGSGKSTLLKAIARILKPKNGRIELLGKNQSDYSPREYAKRIAYVPQTPTFDYATVFDAVLVGRLPDFSSPKQKDYDKVTFALETMGIRDLAMEPVVDLSGGEQQKVSLARALCSDAKLVLLDEPTNNLDLKSKYGVLELIKKMSEQGICVLVSIHDLNDALDLCDEFIVLNDKRTIACGDKMILTNDLLKKVYGLEFEKVEHNDKLHFHIKEKRQ